jgi:adenine-specific DNA-methyltransferase
MTDDRLLAAKKKFSRLLKEIFQFDCADLDFGIYRILAMRRAELERFLDDELLPQVEGILAAAAGDRTSVQSELSKLESTLRDAGIQDFSSSPKWNELKGKLAASPDVAALAREVFSDLTTFFARYYDEGDFMALPRYKGDTYAIPYDGGEVKLHWANADQYYIKTTEQHADYTAVIDGVFGLEKPRLRFRLAAAESDRDNNKSTEKRRYVLRGESPVEVDGTQLTLWFEYRVPDPGNGRQPTQAALCEETEKAVLAAVPPTWQAALTRKASQNPEKYTVLGYQLYRYTKKNTSDYFIHKDLGGFLRRELAFFIKNEVLFLDDIEGRTSAEIDVALQKVKAIRGVGAKILDWLAQIEEFQKRLYLKKPLILRTDWYADSSQIDSNMRSRSDALRTNRESQGRARLLGEKPTQELVPGAELIGTDWASLRAHEFASGLSNGDPTGNVLESCHVIIHGDNFAALRLVGPAVNGGAALVYIDPPYNTGSDGFLYKDGYRRSSWVSMMRERLRCGRRLLRKDGLFLCSISDIELPALRLLQDGVFGESNHLTTLVWNNEGNIDNQSRIKVNHEYVTAYACDTSDWPAPLVVDPNIPENSKLFNDTIENSITKNGPANPPSSVTLPAGFPAAFDEGLIEVDTKAWPKLSNSVRVTDGRTVEPVVATSGWSSRALLDDFLANNMQPINDAKGRKCWFAITKTGAIYGYKERGDEKSHVLSVIRNLGTTKQMSGALARMGLSFDYPKPVGLLEYLCSWCNDHEATVVDFFGGSGTTAHAVLNLNRTGRRHRFVLIEGGDHFDTVTLPRVLKNAVADEWQGTVPKQAQKCDRPIKVLRLESYDDALENITLTRPGQAASLLESRDNLHEDYTLRYMLNLEAEGSLLNLQRFRKPWDYTIKVRRDGVVQDSPVDLVETFNYLIGLRARRYDTYGQEGLLFVIGTDPEGRRVIIVWRDCDLWPNDRLEEKCRQAFESFRPDEFDLVYVNGDNHLPIIKTGEESWKVNLIEETFHARMFDTSDVE